MGRYITWRRAAVLIMRQFVLTQEQSDYVHKKVFTSLKGCSLNDLSQIFERSVSVCSRLLNRKTRFTNELIILLVGKNYLELDDCFIDTLPFVTRPKTSGGQSLGKEIYKKGLSVEYMAELMGLKPLHLASYLNGGIGTLKIYKALSKYTGLPVDSFGNPYRDKKITELGRFLLFYQAQKKLSRVQIYRAIGINKDTYLQITQTKFKPSVYTIVRLMDFFNKPLVFFIDLYTGKVKLEDIKHKFS